MQLTESSIYVTFKNLRKKLYQLKFLMEKTNKREYGDELVKDAKECLKWFIKAFYVPDSRKKYMEEFFGSFAVLKDDLDFCVMQNIIHFTPKKDKKTGEVIEESSQKIELFMMIAKIDEDASKWWASLNKGRTLTE